MPMVSRLSAEEHLDALRRLPALLDVVEAEPRLAVELVERLLPLDDGRLVYVWLVGKTSRVDNRPQNR